MNAQALIQDRYSLSDFEQFVKLIEQLLSAYTWAIVALFVFIAAIAACRAICDSRQSRAREGNASASCRQPTAHQLNDRRLCQSGFDSMKLDQSSAY